MTDEEQRIEVIVSMIRDYLSGDVTGLAVGQARFLLAQYDSLLADKKRLLEGLEFYADEDNWTDHIVESGYRSSYGVKACDGGDKARAMLPHESAIAHSKPEEPK